MAADDLGFMPYGEPAGEILRWYRDAGVDCALEETPRDRLAEARAALEAPRQAPSAGRGNSVSQTAIGQPVATGLDQHIAQAAAEAKALANNATTLDELQTALTLYDGCPLKQTAKSLIFSAGNPHSRIMVVSDVPGPDEDRLGEAFIGPAGQLLDRMLKAIGLDRQQVALGLVIPWRPPGNRTPTQQELAVCEPFIRRHIALVKPDLLVFLGTLPAHLLLGVQENQIKLRGRWFDYRDGDNTIPTLATLPPSHLLKHPAQKAQAWRDLKALREARHALLPRE
jgi:DNA polymerase